MKKIILLDPLGYKKGCLGHYHLLRDWSGSYISGYIPFPPIDLIYAAGYLRAAGQDTEIIEASIKHLSHRQIAKIVKQKDPGFVFIPTTYFSLESDKQLLALIKKELPGIKTVLGGPAVTHQPELALDDGSADFVALGEFELPLSGILKGDYSENIAYRSGNKIISGPRHLLDLADLAAPARDLVNNSAYRYAFFNKRNPVTAMSLSRGCPHSKCKFCNSTLYTLGQIRYRQINAITSEIEEIVNKYKVKEIFFRDQAFTANRGLIFELCEYIISHNLDISFRCTTRVDLVDKELLQLMHKAGCYQISFGFETPSQEALDAMNKGIKVEQARLAAKWAKESGLEVLGLFILGIPPETEQSLKKIVDYALELDVDYAQFDALYLFPGTAVYDEFSGKKPKLLPEKIIKKITLDAFLRFYFRKGFLAKQLKKIDSFEDLAFLFKAGFGSLISYI